jgi:hypothetical protein
MTTFPSVSLSLDYTPLHACNEGHLLVFSDLIQGDGITRCVLFNSMVDISWLVDECSLLAIIPRVDIVHGEKGERAAEISQALYPNMRVHCICRYLTVSITPR